jgi:APA family basic amino acid/polyamine antiporter
MLAVIAVEVLRRREPDLPRPFRVPGYPVVPLLFLAGSAALLYGGLVEADGTALVAFAIMFAGLPFAMLWTRARR